MIPILRKNLAGQASSYIAVPGDHTRLPEMLFVTHVTLISKQQAVIKLTSETSQNNGLTTAKGHLI